MDGQSYEGFGLSFITFHLEGLLLGFRLSMQQNKTTLSLLNDNQSLQQATLMPSIKLLSYSTYNNE